MGDKRQTKQRVVNVEGHDVIAWSLDGKQQERAAAEARGGGGGVAVAAGRKGGSVMKHRRQCQGCKRSVGQFLFCSKCPCVMHKFCVRAEGWGELLSDSSDSAADAEAAAAHDGLASQGDEEAEADWDEDEEDDDDDASDDDFRSSYLTPKHSAGTRQGLRQRAPPPQQVPAAWPARHKQHKAAAHGGLPPARASPGPLPRALHPDADADAVAHRAGHLHPDLWREVDGEVSGQGRLPGAEGAEEGAEEGAAARAAHGPGDRAVQDGAPHVLDKKHDSVAAGARSLEPLDLDLPAQAGGTRDVSTHGVGLGGQEVVLAGATATAGAAGPALQNGSNLTEMGAARDGKGESREGEGGKGAQAGQRHREMRERLARDADWRLFAKILDALLKKREGQHFDAPALDKLPPDEHANYTRVVQRPLDLACIHRRFRDGYYTRLWQLAADVRRVFSNAISYHTSEHATYKAGRRLRKYFSDVCSEVGLEMQQEGTVGEWPHDYLMYLKRLLKAKDVAAFLKPVDPADVPQYADVITRPMSLDVVSARLHNGTYLDATELAEDVRLTFNNAMVFNPTKHPVHTAAKRLLKAFEDQLAKLQMPRAAKASNAAANGTHARLRGAAGGRKRRGDKDDQAQGLGGGQGDVPQALRRSSVRWLCPHHRCVYSDRPASDCGGMLFRCFDCPAAFSDDYLHDGFEPLEVSRAFSTLNYLPPTSAEYIRCAKCVVAMGNASLEPPPELPAELPSSDDDDAAIAPAAVGRPTAERKDSESWTAGSRVRGEGEAAHVAKKVKRNQEQGNVSESVVGDDASWSAGADTSSGSSGSSGNSGSSWLQERQDQEHSKKQSQPRHPSAGGRRRRFDGQAASKTASREALDGLSRPSRNKRAARAHGARAETVKAPGLRHSPRRT